MMADLRTLTDVVQRAARIIQLLLRKDQLAETEVADLHVVQVCVAEDVFRLGVEASSHDHLDVAVDDAHAVQIR